MRLFGLTISRAKPVEKMHQVAGRGSAWSRLISGEPFAGAFQRNISVSLDNVLTNPTVYSCITLIAGDIAKCRLRLVRLDDNGIWTETDSPAFSPVLRKPNRYQTRLQFIRQWMLSKLIYGNTYVLKERDGRGIVVGLYVLDPRRVRVLVADNGDVFYELRRDDLNGIEAETITIPAREIIHDRMNALFHPLVGLSPIFASGLVATHGLNITKNNAKFFSAGARPSGVLTAPGEISEVTAHRLKEYFDNEFTGEKAGKVAVLGDGLKYEPMMMTSVDAQVIEQLKWTAEIICGCFHVPPYMVGVGAAPLNNNVETLKQLYYAQCLQEHIEDIEALLDEGLGLGWGISIDGRVLGTEFDLDDLLRMDGSAMAETVSKLAGAGVMKIDEARKKFNLAPTDGGDTPYLQEQNYSLAALAKRDAKDDPWEATKQKPAPLALPAPEPAPESDEPDETERAVAALRMKFAGALYAA